MGHPDTECELPLFHHPANQRIVGSNEGFVTTSADTSHFNFRISAADRPQGRAPAPDPEGRAGGCEFSGVFNKLWAETTDVMPAQAAGKWQFRHLPDNIDSNEQPTLSISMRLASSSENLSEQLLPVVGKTPTV